MKNARLTKATFIWVVAGLLTVTWIVGKAVADETAETFIIADIKPALAFPADIFFTDNCIGKGTCVCAVFFPGAYVNIADDLFTSIMEGINGFSRCLKKIEFEHIRFSG